MSNLPTARPFKWSGVLARTHLSSACSVVLDGDSVVSSLDEVDDVDCPLCRPRCGAGGAITLYERDHLTACTRLPHPDPVHSDGVFVWGAS